MRKHFYSGKYILSCGISLNCWALPVSIAIGQADFAKRWCVGIRVLCFTVAFEKEYEGYALIHGARLPIE